jgi:endonuclease YncB( thermonuclease family)
MLNEELVRAGLAHVSTYAGDSETMARRLRTAEQEAREIGRGIWSEGRNKSVGRN